MSFTALSIYLLSGTWDLTKKLVQEDCVWQCCACYLAAVCQGCSAWARVTLLNKAAVAYMVLTFCMQKKVFIWLLLGGKNTFDDNLPCEDCSQAELCMSLMLEMQFCQNLSQKTSSLVDYLKSLGSGPSCLFICLFCCCCFVCGIRKMMLMSREVSASLQSVFWKAADAETWNEISWSTFPCCCCWRSVDPQGGNVHTSEGLACVEALWTFTSTLQILATGQHNWNNILRISQKVRLDTHVSLL